MSTSASSALVPAASVPSTALVAAEPSAPPANAETSDFGDKVFDLCAAVAMRISNKRSEAGEKVIISGIEKLAEGTDKLGAELDERSQIRTSRLALLLLNKLDQLNDELTASREYARTLEKRVATLEATVASVTGKPMHPVTMPSLDPKDPANLLRKITRLFHDKQTDRAIAEFEEFEKSHPQIAGQVFGHLWTLAGSPKSGPTAHPDFGKVVFYDKHAPYRARNEQKMEAIEVALKALAANTKK